MTARSTAVMTQAEYRDLLASRMSEETLQTLVLALAKTLGWLAYHTHDSRRSQKGFPDLVLVHGDRGLVLYRELKRAKGRVTAEQQTWLDTLQHAGQDAAIWRPIDHFNGSIERVLRGGG